MRTHLLVIDPQNDFCDIPEELLPIRGVVAPSGECSRVQERPALPVAGADADMRRLAGFINAAGARLSGITVTLDSHPVVGIERTTFWVDAAGTEVAPFTQITAQSVSDGVYKPRSAHLIEPISGRPLTQRVIELLDNLESNGRYTLMAWPVHCVTATWGANIHDAVAGALAAWEMTSNQPVRKVLKGEYPLAEHYGVFEAETPLREVQSTRFNTDLAEELARSGERLLVAGQASSHCVAASVEQLIRYRKGDGTGLVLLTDCMSPVSGFEAGADAFFARAAASGAQLVSSEQALHLLQV